MSNLQLRKDNFLILAVLIFMACNDKNTLTILNAKTSDISIEVDSIKKPELSVFPVRIKINNYSDKKLILCFDSDSQQYLNNMHLISKSDTFNLRIRDKYLIFKEYSTSSFNCSGFFLNGKGSFKDFKNFKNLKLVYFKCKNFHAYINKDNPNFTRDTFITPYIFIGSALNTKIVNKFSPESYNFLSSPLHY